MAKHGTLYTNMINTREWRELRAQVLREQKGLCAWCKAKGYIVPATVVHHMIEVESGKTEAEQRELMFRRSNCVGLCKQCHNTYHQSQGYHSTQKVIERQQERQASWQSQMVNRFRGPSDDGDQG